MEIHIVIRENKYSNKDKILIKKIKYIKKDKKI
jgi:hypothetical protein